MPVWNGESYIKEAIDSVLNQSYMELELIICDDGSTDNTHSIIEKYTLIDSRVKSVSQLHSGKVKALNRAFETSKGQFIVLLAHDDVLYKSSIARRVQSLEDHEVEVCFHNGYICNDTLEPRRLLYPKDYLVRRNLLEVVRRNPIGGGVIGFSRRIAEEVFPIPDYLKFEDWWISFVCILNTEEIEFINDPLILYRIHRKNDNGTLQPTSFGIVKDMSRHYSVYEAFIGYLREFSNASPKEKAHVHEAITQNQKLVFRAVDGKLTFPSLRVLRAAGIKKFLITQLAAKGKYELIKALKDRCFRKDKAKLSAIDPHDVSNKVEE